VWNLAGKRFTTKQRTYKKEGVGHWALILLRANVELQNEKQALLVAQTDRDSSLFSLRPVAES